MRDVINNINTENTWEDVIYYTFISWSDRRAADPHDPHDLCHSSHTGALYHDHWWFCSRLTKGNDWSTGLLLLGLNQFLVLICSLLQTWCVQCVTTWLNQYNHFTHNAVLVNVLFQLCWSSQFMRFPTDSTHTTQCALCITGGQHDTIWFIYM